MSDHWGIQMVQQWAEEEKQIQLITSQAQNETKICSTCQQFDCRPKPPHPERIQVGKWTPLATGNGPSRIQRVFNVTVTYFGFGFGNGPNCF